MQRNPCLIRPCLLTGRARGYHPADEIRCHACAKEQYGRTGMELSFRSHIASRTRPYAPFWDGLVFIDHVAPPGGADRLRSSGCMPQHGAGE
jgi:hypothetical protein